MSVACTIEVTPSRRARHLAAACLAVPAAGLALSAARIAAGPTFLLDAPVGPRTLVAAVLACAAFALAARALATALGRLRPPVHGVSAISVDDDGAAMVHGAAGTSPRPARVVRWCGLGGLTLLVLAPYPLRPGARGRPVALALGRDALSDTAWRRLNVWLRWLDRGPPDPRLPGPDPS